MEFKQEVNLWGDDIPWLVGLREKAARAFAKSGCPTAKTEAWKYSYFKPNTLGEMQIDVPAEICDGHCHCHRESELPFAVYELDFCNGKPHPADKDLPRGLTVKTLVEAIYDNDVKRYLGKSYDFAKFPFAALNCAYLEHGFMIVVEKGTILDKPIYLHYHRHDRPNIWSNPHNIIVLESGAQANIIEHFDDADAGKCFNNIVNEIFIGNSAALRHYTILNESAENHHICLNAVQIKKDGNYGSFYAQNECALARQETLVNLSEEGATATVDGIYRLANGGISDITTNIRHLAPHTYSNQLVKGVVGGNAKGVFQGQIHIEPNAGQTEGYQLHKALLLSDTAEVDCKPELEIFADDVKCSHGATCGDLDSEQLFYMQSRGIELETAKKILIEAYLQEVLQKIDNEDIRGFIETAHR